MRVAIIGCGKMGKALLQSVLKSGKIKREHIIACDISEKALYRVGVKTTQDPSEAYKRADIIIISVKPQQLEDLLIKLSGVKVTSRKIFISVVAGKTTKYFEGFLGRKAAVIRGMPNTPAFIGEGAVALCKSKSSASADLKKAAGILSASGRVVVVNETVMDAVTAVSGSGPAYLFFLAEILVSAARKMGVDELTAKTLVFQTLYGSSLMLMNSRKEPEELRQDVTSPGGTTEAAFEYLKKSDAREIWIKAVLAAKNRARYLSN